MSIQTNLMESDKENELREELDKTKMQLTNLRRGMFGRYDKLVSEFTELHNNLKEIQVVLNMRTECVEEPDFFLLEENHERKVLENSL